MYYHWFENLLHWFSGTVATIGISTIVAMALAFAIAKWQHKHSVAQGDSQDYRETAYQTLSHAIDRFTRQEDFKSPMRLRGDWATVAHALETSDVLSRSIKTTTQKRIWSIQVEYFRRVLLSELKTEEDFLQSLVNEDTAVSRFNHQPAVRHFAPVVRWALKLCKHPTRKEPLSDKDFIALKEHGFDKLVEVFRSWQTNSSAS